MANQKLVAISYCFAFLSVYLCSIVYAMISGKINEMPNGFSLPQTTAMNATSSAVAMLSAPSWFAVLIIVAIATIILVIVCRATMASAL